MRSALAFFVVVCLASAGELHKAAQSCDPDRMQRLLSQHPAVNEVDEEGRTPLHVAIVARQTVCAEQLLAAGADPQRKDREGRTAFAAALKNHPELEDSRAVEQWRQLVAMVRKADQEKAPVPTGPLPWSLEYAISHHQTQSVQMLLQMGADPNQVGTKDVTPLAQAALQGDLEAVRLLLRYHARVDTVDPEGLQAIHNAALGEHAEVIVELAKAGADINARSRHDLKTPLHLAAALGRVKALGALAGLGADLTLKDLDGRTALEVAERAGLTDAAEYLRGATEKKLVK